MGFLSKEGLEYLWGKTSKYVRNAGLTKPVAPDGMPIGTMLPILTATAPVGYLPCDGSEYNIADYPQLAALFLAEFGSYNKFGGDGETTFAVPDMAKRTTIGIGSSTMSLGALGGADTVTLSVTNMPAHSHSMKVSANATQSTSAVAMFLTNATGSSMATAYRFSTFSTKDYSTKTGILNNTGGATAHNNMPPYLIVTWFIKAYSPEETAEKEDPTEYNLEETRVGTWVDGKPIYRKVYKVDKVFASKTMVVDVSDLKIDTPIRTNMIVQGSSNTSDIFIRTDADRDTIYGLNTAKTEFRIYHTSLGTVTVHYAIIEYTKTTDAAGSGEGWDWFSRSSSPVAGDVEWDNIKNKPENLLTADDIVEITDEEIDTIMEELAWN